MDFKKELWERISHKWTSGLFLYFLVAIVILSGTGVFFSWYEVYHSEEVDNDEFIKNVATYFFSLLTISVVDMFRSTDVLNRLSFQLFSILFFLIGFALLFFTYNSPIYTSYIITSLGVIISWGYWILANVTDPKFSDKNFNDAIWEEAEKHGKNWKKTYKLDSNENSNE